MLNDLKIGTKIGASFALGLAILTTIGLVSYQNITKLIETSRLQTHTYQVLGNLEDLISKVKDAETGQRGFLLTGERRYLEPYTAATQKIDQDVNELKRLTADNPTQQDHLNALQPLIANKLAELQETINLRQQTQGFEAALRVVRTDRGKNLMDDIRHLAENMETEERELLDQRSKSAETFTHQTIDSILYGIPLTSLLLALIGFLLVRNISKPLQEISGAAHKIGVGDLSVSLTAAERQDEIGILAQTFNQMIAQLRDTTQKNDEQGWLKSNLAKFTQMLQGQRNLETISKLIVSNLASLVGAQQGVFYLMDFIDEQPVLKLLSSYAYQERKHLANQFRLGEGLVGQCALEKEKILLTEVPSDYIRISSGLGEAVPLNIIVIPVLFETQVTAVIELASFYRFSEIHLTFLDQVSESIAVVMSTIAAGMRTEQLLQQSQSMAEELQSQQAELTESNQLLGQQADFLRTSEELLKQQQEELQQSNEELQQLNEELEEKADLLAAQNQEVERKNQEVEQTRRAMEEKAEQLELSSRYKSEFLANMSHELRTPLNSLLILSKLLSDNSEGNLTTKQVEYSRTIHSSGTDLLGLINDILDLAKIESGTMSINIDQVRFTDMRGDIERTFRQIAQNKGLSFTVALDEKLPSTMQTDSKRLQQVLKNLLSNAFKFTEQGQIALRIEPVTQGWSLDQEQLNHADQAIAFAVSDTGIGIAADKQKLIFEAFQQADGTTSRKYGGTGLGLSISREIAHLLGGQIRLTSSLGQGSTFTLYVPLVYKDNAETQKPKASVSILSPTPEGTTPVLRTAQPAADWLPKPPITPPPLPDDRNQIQPGDRVLLIVEDDINFAHILLDMARAQGFKGLVALQGETGLAMAQEFKPDAITLDIRLPDADGWLVLDRLKHDSNTRHIPVHIISGDDGGQRGLQLGAVAYLQKPLTSEAITKALTEMKEFVERQIKNLLVVEDDKAQRQSIVELIGNGDVQTTAVGTGAEALTALETGHFDCLVLDLGLPDMTGFELIERIKQLAGAKLPIIVYTGKDLTRQEETELKRIAGTIIIKDVRSPERLLDETSLFLHRVQANLPQPQRRMLEQLNQVDPVLLGKKVLIVDDDVRNIFALTGLLERYQMQVLYAENGRAGIDSIQSTPDLDIVLMDIMMPEMDGYETMRAVRQQPQFRSLPIIALTAKAMQGDREKCIAAGASDYITKPVDSEQLLSLLRVWLYR